MEIKFKTAVLAKEKGFDVKLNNTHYNANGDLWQGVAVGECEKDMCLAPTQSTLQKWLREEHELHVTVDTFSYEFPGSIYFVSQLKPLRGSRLMGSDLVYAFNTQQEKDTWRGEGLSVEVFENFERVLEIGLQKALKLIVANNK